MKMNNNKSIYNDFNKFLERYNTFKSLCKERNQFKHKKKYYLFVVEDRVLVEYSPIEEYQGILDHFYNV